MGHSRHTHFARMACKGLRAISYLPIAIGITPTFFTGYNPSHTTETLIGYTACCAVVIF